MKPEDTQQPDKRSDSDQRLAASQVGAALSAPGMPAGLRESLSEKLDRAFLTSDAGMRGRAREAVREHTLEILLRVKQEASACEAQADGKPSGKGRAAVHPLARRSASRGGWSVAVAVGLSAAVLAAISLSNQPRYNWDSMVEAIRSRPVVQVTHVAQDTAHQSRILTQKTDASFDTPLTASSLHVTQALGGVLEGLRQDPADLRSVRDTRFNSHAVSRQLLSLLSQGDPADPSSDLQWQVLGCDKPEIVDGGVRLEIRFKAGTETLHASFLLDPHSHLPLSCEVLSEKGQTVRSCTFEFLPAE